MACYQEFNTQQVLGKAMNVFWDKGYKGASLCDLLDEMSIGKGRFYAAFGSKRELFLDALKLYGKKQAMVREVANIMSCLPAKQSIELMELMFERVIDWMVEDKRCCMFGKTALEFWQSDAAIAKEVEAGEISPDKDPDSIAHFLTGIFYGLQVTGSALPDR